MTSVEKISLDILAPLTISKVADEILSPMEKQAENGIVAFGRALSGSKLKNLEKQIAEVTPQLAEKATNPKLNAAYDEVEKLKNATKNSSVHDRMTGVKENLAEKRKRYDEVVRNNDETLNKYTGIKKLLKPISPGYIGAKAENFIAGRGVKNAKEAYRGQERRVKHDLKDEISAAESRYGDVKKELGINGTQEHLQDLIAQRDKAKAQTSAARKVVAVGGAGAAGLGYYNYEKNKPGQYYYSGSDRTAAKEESAIDKIADEILLSMRK